MAIKFTTPPDSAAAKRSVEQRLELALQEIRRLWDALSQQRNQVGNAPVDPDTVLP